MRVNKYGLTDTIASPVKREVRQRCGFGCVNCGNAVYQYEHLEPTFAEAKEHNPDHIVLLCGGCHDRVSRKILSKETIKVRSQNPICKQKGFSFGPFDLGLVEPTVKIGTLTCKNVESLIQIDGESIFSIKKPECEGAPFRINAYLADRDGTEVLKITDNEWVTSTSNWDVEVVGPKITIRKGLGDITLVLRTEAPHSLIVERLEMVHRGVKISCRENSNLEVVTRSGQVLKSASMNITGCKVGFDISNNSLAIGVGGGSVYIGNMTIGHQPTFPFPTPSTPKIILRKVGRNEPCSCQSGKKYKKCCGSVC
ncbi:CRISPR-associated Cas5-like protein [Vibrio crassostreae]|uniref:SEC-C metal-binding domain-containing protein n=1 Tax=Vibrio crassostreae TaxID=246167 RepID=UPI0010451FC8|nr:SEC-C metal-binding domain-containing protein [Vibrio crassostreae]TCV17902.1 CRISPR-associated Cas5-like protein [Vibrio crassostreae]